VCSVGVVTPGSAALCVGVNLDLCVRTSVSRFETVEELSMNAVMLTFGMFWAIHWSSLTSSIVASTIAVATITTPSPRWSASARRPPRRRSRIRRPPSASANSIRPVPTA
jgi:hypothetical protein